MGNDASLGRGVPFLFFYCHGQGHPTCNISCLISRWSHCKVHLIGRALRLLLGYLVGGRTLLTLLTALAIRRRGVAYDTLLFFD